jgi:hypothetical protein
MLAMVSLIEHFYSAHIHSIECSWRFRSMLWPDPIFPEGGLVDKLDNGDASKLVNISKKSTTPGQQTHQGDTTP